MSPRFTQCIRFAAIAAVTAVAASSSSDARASGDGNYWIATVINYPSTTCQFDSGGNLVGAFAQGYLGVGPISNWIICDAFAVQLFQSSWSNMSYCAHNQGTPPNFALWVGRQDANNVIVTEGSAQGAWGSMPQVSVPGYTSKGSAGGTCGTISAYMIGMTNPSW